MPDKARIFEVNEKPLMMMAAAPSYPARKGYPHLQRRRVSWFARSLLIQNTLRSLTNSCRALPANQLLLLCVKAAGKAKLGPFPCTPGLVITGRHRLIPFRVRAPNSRNADSLTSSVEGTPAPPWRRQGLEGTDNVTIQTDHTAGRK